MASPRPHVLKYAAGLAVALLVASVAHLGVVNAVEARFEEDRWSSDAYALAARHAYAFLAAEEERTDSESVRRVYFVGSSTMRDDLDARAVEAALAGRGIGSVEVFNLAVSGDTPLRRAPEVPLVARAAPDLVIVGLDRFSLFDPAPGELLNRFTPLRGVVPVPPAGSDLAAVLGPEYVSALEPPSVWDVFQGDPRSSWERRGVVHEWVDHRAGEAAARVRGLVGASGGGAGDGAAPLAPNASRPLRDVVGNVKDPWLVYRVGPEPGLDEGRLAHAKQDMATWREQWTRTSPDGANARALEFALDELASAGVPVVLMHMPINPAVAEAVDVEQERDFGLLLASIAERRGVPVVDESLAWDPAYFYDHAHMNDVGRRAFSGSAADLVARHLGE